MTTATPTSIPTVTDVRREAADRLRRATEPVVRQIVWTGLRVAGGAGRVVVRLDEADLLRAGRRRAGGGSYQDTAFLEGLRRLVGSLEAEAQLNLFGRLAARQHITRLLANRLLLERDRQQHPEIAAQDIRQPVFITGVPRSGSTLLHGLLAQDPASRVPQTWEMLYPSPRPARTSYDNDPRIGKVDRQLRWFQTLAPRFRTIHHVGARLPEECIMMLAHSFMGTEFCSMFGVPSYQAWLDQQDLVPAYEQHRRFLQHLQSRCAGERWVLKAPGHMARLRELFTVYPDARVIMTHRDPLEVLGSEASLQFALRHTFSDAADPIAVGHESTRSLAAAIRRGLHVRDGGGVSAAQFFDVRYQDLENDPIGTAQRIYAFFGLCLTNDVEARMRDFVARNPKGTHGRHEYSLRACGLRAEEERERYRGYRERFGV